MRETTPGVEEPKKTVYNAPQSNNCAPGRPRSERVLLLCEPGELLLVPYRLLPKPTRTGKRESFGCSFGFVAAHLPTLLERAVKLSDKDEKKKVREGSSGNGHVGGSPGGL